MGGREAVRHEQAGRILDALRCGSGRSAPVPCTAHANTIRVSTRPAARAAARTRRESRSPGPDAAPGAKLFPSFPQLADPRRPYLVPLAVLVIARLMVAWQIPAGTED